MKFRVILASALLLGVLSACSLPHKDMTSPCAGADGSPCDRHPVNDWWMHSRTSGENS